MKKLILFLVFATALVFTLVIINVGAATEGTPIYTVEDFEKMDRGDNAEAELGTYYLANDIDFAGKEYKDCIIKHFSGTLDGNGKAIFNFTIKGTNAEASDIGVIRRSNRDGITIIKNLNVGKPDALVSLSTDANGKSHAVLIGANNNSFYCEVIGVNLYADLQVFTDGKVNCGGFVGYCRTSKFTDCTMNGKITVGVEKYVGTEYRNAGGYIGALHGADTSFKNCSNYADITVYGSINECRAGGLVSYCEHPLTIEGCKNYGNLSVLDYDSLEYGYIKSDSQCGGIIAHENKNKVTIKNCENHGQLICTGKLGAIIGYVSPSNSGDVGAVIENCLNDGKLTANAVEYQGAYGAVNEGGVVTVTGFTNNPAEMVEYTTLLREATTTTSEDDEDDEDEETSGTTAAATTPKVTEATTPAPSNTNKTNDEKDEKTKSCGSFSYIAAAFAVICGAVGVAVIKKH